MLRNDGSTVAINNLLTAAFGGNKPFRNNVAAQHQSGFGITHLCEERGCFRALRNNFLKRMERCESPHSLLSNGEKKKERCDPLF